MAALTAAEAVSALLGELERAGRLEGDAGREVRAFAAAIVSRAGHFVDPAAISPAPARRTGPVEGPAERNEQARRRAAEAGSRPRSDRSVRR